MRERELVHTIHILYIWIYFCLTGVVVCGTIRKNYGAGYFEAFFFLTEEHALGLQPKVVCACTPDACTVCACMQYVGLFCVMQRIKMASQARRTQVWSDREEEEEDSKTASKFLSSCFVQIKSNTTELIFKDTFKDTLGIISCL